MSSPEQPSTYFVFDQSSQEELNRLRFLDHATTLQMGGVLPEQEDPSAFKCILDVGCGTGNWLIELARQQPEMTLLIGVDANHTLIEYARTLAQEAGVSHRVEFHVADALRMLEFPNGFFDLVNHRFAWSWLRTWDWPKLLSEYQRVARPQGLIRITECDLWHPTSPAQQRLNDLLVTATSQAGRLFTKDARDILSELAPLLKQHGFHQVQERAYTFEIQATSPGGPTFFEAIKLSYLTSTPFLRKWTQLPKDYEALLQQALLESQQPTYIATWNVVTVWGHASAAPQTQPPVDHSS